MLVTQFFFNLSVKVFDTPVYSSKAEPFLAMEHIM